MFATKKRKVVAIILGVVAVLFVLSAIVPPPPVEEAERLDGSNPAALPVVEPAAKPVGPVCYEAPDALVQKINTGPDSLRQCLHSQSENS